MKGFFFLTTSLQILNAIEAQKYFAISESTVFLSYDENNKLEKDQIESVLALVQWQRIIRININQRKRIKNYVRVIKKLKRMQFNYLFVGYVNLTLSQIILSNIKAEKTLALDDGTITIIIQRNKPKKLNLFDRLKFIRYKLLGLSFTYKPIIDSFTSYSFLPSHQNQQLIFHNFDYLKTLLNSDKKKINQIYFLGVAFLDTKIMKEQDFIDCLKQVKKYYDKKEQEIIYIPHRREKVGLEKIPFEIKKINRPIELEFLLSKEIPVAIGTFFSSAIFNLDNIANVPLDVFVLPTKKIKKKIIEIEDVYKDIRINTSANIIALK